VGNLVTIDFFDKDNGNVTVCRHFATAAVAMYRAFGIPARYTVGYSVNAREGFSVEVTTLDAHAWVEIYVDGMGWVPVEVTGSSNGGIEIEPEETYSKKAIVIKPRDIIVSANEYKGGDLVHDEYLVDVDGRNVFLTLQDRRNYTYEATIESIKIAEGQWETRITAFVLYNEKKENVTDDFQIVFQPGIMKVTDKVVVELTLPNVTKLYGNGSHAYTEANRKQWGYTLHGNRIDGITVEFDVEKVTALTEVGRVKDADILKWVRVLKYGVDITDECEFLLSERRLAILARYIKIEAFSDEKIYTGEPFEVNETITVVGGMSSAGDKLYIESNSLLDGHTLTVLMSGRVSDVGEGKNRIISYTIIDAEGVDVTLQYDVDCIDGVLRIIE
jgi:hypothetical protein